MYLINFTKVNTKFCLSLHCDGDDRYLFVNGTEIHKFKAKDSMIVRIIYAIICINYIIYVSKDFSASNMKKTKNKKKIPC